MKTLSRIGRGLAAVLLWLVAFILMLVAVILCVTVLLAPVGLPLGAFAARLFSTGFQLILPKPLRQAAAAPEKAAGRAREGFDKLLPGRNRKRKLLPTRNSRPRLLPKRKRTPRLLPSRNRSRNLLPSRR